MNKHHAFERIPASPPPSVVGFSEILAPPLRPPAPRRHYEFDVRMACTEFDHDAADMLVRQMYERRGYDTTTFASAFGDPNRTTLVVWQGGMVIATMTVGCDSTDGLLADTLYQREIDRLRGVGRVICEASALATHPEFSSADMLVALFDSALHHSRDVWGASDAVIEVNPRHAPYYRHKFGFKQIGQLRQCPRVNAPAVLMHRSLDELEIIPHDRLPD